MDAATRAPGYDLFKLIVAIILLILAIMLMWLSPSRASTPLLPTGTALATLTVIPASRTSSARTATPFLPPSPILPQGTEPTATPPPFPPQVTATPPPRIPAPTTACEAAVSRSRLQVGANAAILRRLNFRSSPGIRENWLLTTIPGTRVQVVGGPECVPYWTGAYLWWQIRLPDGRVGWSAESSLRGSFYFMEPLP